MSKTNGFSGPCGFGPDHFEVAPLCTVGDKTDRKLNGPPSSKSAIRVRFIGILFLPQKNDSWTDPPSGKWAVTPCSSVPNIPLAAEPKN